jgi:hypothetical protein
VLQPPTPEPTTFKEYCKTLPDWTQYLLKDITYLDDLDDIHNILQSKETIYFVMDGRETDGIGYFGWVISMALEIVVESKGHAPGLKSLMESLRTESISTLLLLCFLYHFSTFYQLTITPNAWIQYCDNKTIIK